MVAWLPAGMPGDIGVAANTSLRTARSESVVLPWARSSAAFQNLASVGRVLLCRSRA